MDGSSPAAGAGGATPVGTGVEAHLSVLGRGHGARTAAVVWTQSAPHAMLSLSGFTERLGTARALPLRAESVDDAGDPPEE